MRRRAILGLVAATVAALLLGSATPALASEGRWAARQPCARGALTAEWPADETLAMAKGWIEPCRSPRPWERFGVIYYVREPDGTGRHGYVYAERLRPFDGRRRTAFEGEVSVEPRYGTLLGVCLAYGPGKLVACVQPKHTGQPESGPRLPLPPIRELARVDVTVLPESQEPNCGSCV
jgi:hypothetical protein